MLKGAVNQIKLSLKILILLSILTGILYPLFITGVATLIFPYKANGSLISDGHKIMGSYLIGQPFSDTKYFWSRPSSTPDFPYNALHSAGSNLDLSNTVLLETVFHRAKTISMHQPNSKNLIPIDLITASASGLDPDISPYAAFYQIPRVAKARGLSDNDLMQLVQQHITTRFFGIFGEPRVNVLMLNLALDQFRGDHD